ncbi:hypothetical protein V6B16_10545 [Salinimicrobium catena]|uniref:hypothetical protein n=1 Tax=Salinimicrobium catena TaxID=390640 RepID=UPI002FE47385
MKTKFFSTVLVATLFFFISCGESTDVVESGTYEGTIKEVEASKTEIYVETDDNKTLELYFTDQTELTRDGSTVDFSELEEGMRVEVEVKKEGKRLDPISVKVLE